MSNVMLEQIAIATWQTIYMVLISSAIATIIGLPLGIILVLTRKNGLLQNLTVNRILAACINALRSIPFIILLIAVVPITRFIVGTSIGTSAAIVPLTIGAFPFIARIVEVSLSEVNSGLIEAGIAMGATNLQIITKILIPEALSGMIQGITVVIISLIGYSAMAGAIGGGGLGDLAIRYGYQRFEISIMIITVVILIILVQLMQYAGDWLAKKWSHRG
ncbi:MAG: methionine ABC transporter permease [Pseudomonadota bacterium]